MVTNNKVLTVSYGTFACTLEGFDDSFDAMKAIAEYFRDLAADDRYFGAEPPTPDAEMLTRIAEREIERRVQARTEAGAIVLSAAPADTVDTPVAAEAETDAAEAPVAEPIVDDSPEHVEETIQDDVIADVIAEAAEADISENITEDVVEAVQADVLDDAFEIEAFDEDDDTDNLFEEAYDSLSDADDILDVDPADDLSNIAEAPEAEAEPAAEDSIAAKLRRIRAVVSKVETEDEIEDDFIEDQHAEDMAPQIEDPALQEVAVAEGAPIEDAFEDELVAEDLQDEDFEEDEIEIEEAPVAAAPKPRARVIRMKRTEFEDAIADGLLEEEDEPVAETAAIETSLSDEDEADLMAQLAEVEAEMGDIAAETEVEAEIEPEVEVDEVDSPIPENAEPTAPATPVRPRRARRVSLEEQAPEDEAVDRLIEEANTKLDEPEGNRRRSAIAHLRAAVAATKAEKEAGASLEKPDQSEAYRDDLASTMRPNRAEKSDRAERKAASPLKLVAAQRIDDGQEDDKPNAAVRPRRVSVDEVTAAEANENSSDFVEFAENMGATQLPDVLEAAASYLTFVEGRHRFSRPMLMRLAYQVGEERFEREAGLRSFGQLLRDKKIEKIAGGRFTVSESINFKPGDRAAG